LIKEQKLLKCLEQQEEPGLELDEDDDGFLDTDCVTVDTTTGECLSQSVFDDYILNVSNLNHLFFEGRFMDAEEYERMHSGSKWIIWVGLLLTITGLVYWFYKKDQQLPGVFSTFKRYQSVNNKRLDLEEDEPPLALVDEGQNDEDDILA